MIKVGDWVTHNITGERFEIIEYNDKYVWLRKENGYREITTHETLYKWLYMEQKQRADELEKQNDILKHNIRVELDSSRHMYIGMCEQKQRADEFNELLNYYEHNIVEIQNELKEKAHRNKTMYERNYNDLFKGRYEASNTAINKIRSRFFGKHAYDNYLSEKLRADRAEKRWEKLKEHFIKEKEQSFGILSWSRNDGMLELIQRLEEDGE